MIEDVKRAKEGNKECLEKIIIENISELYKIAFAITRNEEDSKDAIGLTTLKVCEKIRTLKKTEFFKTWLVRILINECNNLIKKNKKTINYDEVEKQMGCEESISSFAIRETINKLNKNFKEIIILYYYNDLSVKEISQILHIAEGTVKSRLSRAREELRKYNIEEMEG